MPKFIILLACLACTGLGSYGGLSSGGHYLFYNVQNKRFLDAYETGSRHAVTRPLQNDGSQTWIIKSAHSSYYQELGQSNTVFTIQQEKTMKYLDGFTYGNFVVYTSSHSRPPSVCTDVSGTVAKCPCAPDDCSQVWQIKRVYHDPNGVNSDMYEIHQGSTDYELVAFSDAKHDYGAVTRPNSKQHWVLMRVAAEELENATALENAKAQVAAQQDEMRGSSLAASPLPAATEFAVPLPVLVVGMAASSLITFLLSKYYYNGLPGMQQPLLAS